MQTETAKPPRLKLGSTPTQAALDLVVPPAPRVEEEELFPDEPPPGWHVEQYQDRWAVRGPAGECKWFIHEGAARASVLDPGELFPQDQVAEIRFPKFCKITCRVCGLRAKIAVDAPALLCGPCSIDLTLTRNSLESQAATLDSRARVVRTRWTDAWGAAPEEAQVRWERAQDAGVEPAQAFSKTWQTRHTDDTPLAALLVAWEVTEQECSEIERHRRMIVEGLCEIELAEQSSSDTNWSAYWAAALARHRALIAAGCLSPVGAIRVSGGKKKDEDDADQG